MEAACGAGIQAAADQKVKREQERLERAAMVDNRRRIERETRDALRADNRAQGGQGQSKADKDKTFRAKEKRKRDNGQQSSGKNWVEEEKRLLKQSGDSGFGFD